MREFRGPASLVGCQASSGWGGWRPGEDPVESAIDLALLNSQSLQNPGSPKLRMVNHGTSIRPAFLEVIINPNHHLRR